MSFIPALKPNTPPMPSEIQTLKAWRATNDYAARLSQAQADTVALSAKVDAAQDALTAAYQADTGIEQARAILEDARAALEEAEVRHDALLEGEEAAVTAAAGTALDEAFAQAEHAAGEKARLLRSIRKPLQQITAALEELEAADKDAGRWNRAVRWLSVRAGIGGHRLETIETGRLLGVFKRECGYAKRTLDGEQVI